MKRRAFLALAPAAAMKADAPAISLRWHQTRWDIEGQPTQFGVVAFLDSSDTGVRAFEVQFSWKAGFPERTYQTGVIACRGYGGEARAEILTGPCSDIQVQAWALRRQEQL